LFSGSCFAADLKDIFDLTGTLSAGVIGLHAAVEALEAGYKVKLIAKHLPNDIDPHYPSPM
jgi:hypothetical protein